MRRLLQLHPQVKKIYHESFLLKKCPTREVLLKFVEQRGINPKDNWGEKVPFYPSARKYPIVRYCQTWYDFFGSNSRIIHIVRHPYDISLSTVKKFKQINDIEKPLKVYRKIMPGAIENIGNIKTSYTFKYEDLLIDPDRMIEKVYSHCGLKPDIDYKSRMKQIKNKRYQIIDPSRAFAYKDQKVDWPDFKDVIDALNKIQGVKYTS